jgi:uncharacterized membrane protein YsdA (DUF1294 family)
VANAPIISCAIPTHYIKSSERIVLLVLPGIAGQRFGAGFQWVGAYGALLSALTYWVYAVDKRRAEERLWRVPEARLHLLELLGGWPGAGEDCWRLQHVTGQSGPCAMAWSGRTRRLLQCGTSLSRINS